MNKKIILTGLICGFVSSAAMADGIYISPKISVNTLSVDEVRVEHAAVNGVWSEFTGNKHESWSGDKTNVNPKFAIGYDFDLNQYGIVSVEAEYGATKNYFNGVGLGADLSKQEVIAGVKISF